MQLIPALLAFFLIASAASAQVSKVDGTAMSSGGTPSLTNCGSGPSLTAGSTDGLGEITIGTGLVTACTLSFSHTLTNAPFCTITSNSVAVVTAMTSRSSSSVTFGFSVSLGGGLMTYNCPGAI